MNKADTMDSSKELNDAIFRIINDQSIHLISRFKSAQGTIRLRVDNKEKVKIILENKEFIHQNQGGNLLNQEYIDMFYVNTAEFLESLNTFLRTHQENTTLMIDKEMVSTKLFEFASKRTVSWLQKINRFIGEKSFKHDIEEISLGYAVVYRIINEVEAIISFYELNKDTTKAKGVPELLLLLKNLRYSFQNLLRSQRNYHNSFCELGEINFGLPTVKLSTNL